MAVATVNASLAVMRSDNYLWVNLELAVLVCLSYEAERTPMRQFIKYVCRGSACFDPLMA